MTYRTSAEPDRPVVVRRVPLADSFSLVKLLAGLLFVVGTSYLLWAGTTSSVRCEDTRCAVIQKRMLREPEAFAFDARNPPEVVLEPVKMGKNGNKDGRRLLLRYRNGTDVELLRDWPFVAEAEAARMRAYFGNPRGKLVVERSPDVIPQVLIIVAWVFGLAMFLDGLRFLGWRRLRADAKAHSIEYQIVILGLTVRRQTFAVGTSTIVGTAPLRPGDTRMRINILTLEDEGIGIRRLPIRDWPETRALVEELVALAS